jgi:hypothetical protein
MEFNMESFSSELLLQNFEFLSATAPKKVAVEKKQ